GLEICDVKEGSGDPVKPGATVVVHYVGWLTEAGGVEVDSSRARNEKIEFPLANLIKGWQEGIPGMKPGGVRRLKIPPELGYGDRGVGDKIPGGATLVFEIELFESK
ncbi:MAG: FKBP-type peptidyl-prolyl cis-trans isomerase, partial [Gemmataceae bacterium]|nr:FKBP-type peptidyl-prolyl cis-trans isomerase [Gemmataceae bacterium]